MGALVVHAIVTDVAVLPLTRTSEMVNAPGGGVGVGVAAPAGSAITRLSKFVFQPFELEIVTPVHVVDQLVEMVTTWFAPTDAVTVG